MNSIKINRRDLTWFLVKQNCEGCIYNCLSQKDHSGCFDRELISLCESAANQIVSIIRDGSTDDKQITIGAEAKISDSSTI
jgi:hypothetical protein